MSKGPGLRISKDLELPRNAVTQKIAVVARTGMGKTYTSNVLAEEFLEAGIPFVVVDPMGVWWGLRAGRAGGSRGGYPVVILGGEHADVPLNPDMGGVSADFVASTDASVVVDVSGFDTKGEQVRFVSAFADRLFHKNRRPRHVFLEEADEWAPQRPLPGEQVMLSRISRLVRRGRTKGLGATMITQRPATLHKDILTQAEVLICGQITAPQDRDAVEEWVKHQAGDKKQRDVFLKSLTELRVGQVWLWSPSWLRVFERIQIRRRRTFDASKTPEHGGEAKPPKSLKEVDLGELKEAFAQAIEQAKRTDPELLRRELAVVKAKLAKARKAEPKPAPPPPPVAAAKEVKVPALKPMELHRLEREVGKAERLEQRVAATLKEAQEHTGKVAAVAAELRRVLAEARVLAQARPAAAPPAPVAQRPRLWPRPAPAKPAPAHAAPAAAKEASSAGVVEVAEGSNGMKPAHRGVLVALAQLSAIGVNRPPKEQLGTWAGHSPTSSTYKNYVGALRTWGYVEYPEPGTVTLTAKGAAEVGEQAPPTREELLKKARGIVGEAKWGVLEPLLAAYPEAMAKDKLAEASRHSPTSSTYKNYLGALRTAGLVTYPEPGTVRASDTLMLV